MNPLFYMLHLNSVDGRDLTEAEKQALVFEIKALLKTKGLDIKSISAIFL